MQDAGARSSTSGLVFLWALQGSRSSLYFRQGRPLLVTEVSRSGVISQSLSMVTQEEYDAATKLAASGENTGIKALPQDKQLKLYGWFKQVKEGDNTTAAPGMMSMPGSKVKWEAWEACKGIEGSCYEGLCGRHQRVEIIERGDCISVLSSLVPSGVALTLRSLGIPLFGLCPSRFFGTNLRSLCLFKVQCRPSCSPSSSTEPLSLGQEAPADTRSRELMMTHVSV